MTRFFPPPGRKKVKARETVPVVKRIDDPTAPDGYREVCNEPAWRIRRGEVWERDGGLCQRCLRKKEPVHKFVPLHDVKNEDGEVVLRAGHCHHKTDRGLGGSNRDDRKENLEMVCWPCHPEADKEAKSAGRQRSRNEEEVDGNEAT